ncbi:MAG: protoporphyrinogen oxidase [Desertifilum sp. SIO1I2]|nr:protoporphyrinogen oxidase [Desertifilum sp. SIO1I2]
MSFTDLATPSHPLDTLVIGAGISGLSLAFSLQQRQTQVLVCESQNRIGGNITTGQADGFLWEEGPNSFAPTPALLRLIVDAGLEKDMILADRRLPRFVYRQGRLQAIPMSPPAAIGTPLLSWSGKLRAGLGAIGFVRPPLGEQYSQQGSEETVAQFFQRHLGQEVTERLVTPFVSGVYAGDVNQLSAAAAFRRIAQLEGVGGGLVAGAILSRAKAKSQPQVPVDPSLPKTRPGELGSFQQGLQMLPQALAAKLGEAVRLNWRLLQITPTTRQSYIAEFGTPEGTQIVEARRVVLTTPAYITAEILEAIAPLASQALRAIEYPPVANVVLAYPESALKQPLKGFGHLIPRSEGIRTLGTIWSSSLFPGRVPPGWQLLTNYIGGATDPGILDLDRDSRSNLDGNRIAQAVHQDIRRILLKQEVQPKVLAVHLWKRAIPQYNLGHHQRLQTIFQSLAAFPGLHICSNYTDGVALGDCVRRAQELADILTQKTE